VNPRVLNTAGNAVGNFFYIFSICMTFTCKKIMIFLHDIHPTNNCWWNYTLQIRIFFLRIYWILLPVVAARLDHCHC